MIDSFKINNYKGFKKFELNNLSQINIISGSNNTGKTALLEAISILKSSNNLRTLRKNIALIFKSRDLDFEDLETYFKQIRLSITFNEILIKIEHHFKDELEIDIEELDKRLQREFDGSEEFLIMYHNNKVKDIMKFERRSESSFYFTREKYDTVFIDSSKPNNSDLTTLYSSIQDLEIQDKFLKYLQIIDKNIIRIEPQLRERKSFLRITLENPQRSLFSSELGEGTNRFIEILCVLLSNSNGTVLIDEIENGIHYTKLYDIWKAIIQIVQDEKIQLFVTTHDLESIEALNDASETMSFNRITSIKLQKDKNNTIYPVVRKYSSFIATVDSGMDIR